jgi:hypothetical protein
MAEKYEIKPFLYFLFHLIITLFQIHGDGLKLASPFGEHMVLQRDQPILHNSRRIARLEWS